MSERCVSDVPVPVCSLRAWHKYGQLRSCIGLLLSYADCTRRNVQAEVGKPAEDGWCLGTRGGQLPSDQLSLPDQLPVAATTSSEESDEWWAVSTSADGSLDISAILQKTFLGTDTCKSIAEPNGMSAAQYRQWRTACKIDRHGLRVYNQLAILPNHIAKAHAYRASLPNRILRA